MANNTTTQNDIAAARGFIGWCRTMGIHRHDTISAAYRAMKAGRIPFVDGRALQAIVAQEYDGASLPTAYVRRPASFREVQDGISF